MTSWNWPLVPTHQHSRALPERLVTRRPFDAGGALDPAVALVLPSAEADSAA